MVRMPKLNRRARIIVAVSAAAAVTGAALLVQPWASAGVQEVPFTASSSDGPPQNALNVKVLKKAPAGSRRLTSKLALTPGKHGKAFDPKVTISPRITGGTAANSADYPNVVGIETVFVAPDNTGKNVYWVSTCTGTVLSATRVLTAGHCSVDMPYGTTYVIAGRNNIDLDTNGFVARVASAWTMPSFNYQALVTSDVAPVDDVTVLTLKDKLDASLYPAVSLAAQGAADPAEGTTGTIVGYGITTGGGSDAGILRMATEPIKSDATCSTAWPTASAKFDGTRMLCAGILNAVDTCNGDSGGPIFTGDADARVEVGITDWGTEDCKSNYGVFSAVNHYSDVIKAQITATGANNLDWTGDGHTDLVAREPATGKLWVASGAGLSTNTYGGLSVILNGDTWGTGWNNYTQLFRVNSWASDGVESIFARDKSGRLFNYRSDNSGGFEGHPSQIGSGWNFKDVMVTNNWTGNGLPNLIGRTTDGKLVLYNANGKGGWLNPKGTQIGVGWGTFNTILTPGSWLGDGHQSLIGRKPNGELWLFNSDGKGGWTNPKGTRIGTGWGGFSTFLAPGDWSGDRNVDMMGVAANGDLRVYTTNGKGGWINAKGIVVDHGWNAFNKIF